MTERYGNNKRKNGNVVINGILPNFHIRAREELHAEFEAKLGEPLEPATDEQVLDTEIQGDVIAGVKKQYERDSKGLRAALKAYFGS